MSNNQTNQTGLLTEIYSNNSNDTWKMATLSSPTHQLRYFAIRDAILKRNIDNLLDLGCGNGVVEFLLPDNITCMSYDLDTHAINLAKELNKSKKNRNFEVGDIEKLRDDNSQFQAVLISEVLEHLEDDRLLLDIAWEKLQSGGLIFLTLPNVERFNERIRKTLKNRVKYMHSTHFREYNIQSAIDLVKDRFELLDITGVCFSVPFEQHVSQNTLTPFSVLLHRMIEHIPSLATWLLLVAQKK